MSSLTQLADRLDALAHKIAQKKNKKGCRYTRDTSGRWKWVCGPGGQPGDSETHSSQDTPGGSPDSGGAVGGDGGEGGGAGGAGGGGGGGGA